MQPCTSTQHQTMQQKRNSTIKKERNSGDQNRNQWRELLQSLIARSLGSPALGALASDLGSARHEPTDVVTVGAGVGDDAAGLGVDAEGLVGAVEGLVAALHAGHVDVAAAR